MGIIDTIYRLGDDALDNQVEISISPLPFFQNINEELKLRVTSFDIPEFSVGTYEVNYKSQTFTKPNGRITTGNEFSFTFRGDKYWNVYDALMSWKKFIANEDTGILAEDVGSITGTSTGRTDIIISPVDTNGTVTSGGWVIKKAFIQSLSNVSFDQTSDGQPIEITATFQALKIIHN